MDIQSPPTSFLAGNFLDSILEAISQEIAANNSKTSSFNLDIDGIRHLQNSGGRFVYRLMLSNPVNFSPEQVLQFKARHTKGIITATVVTSDDDGLVIETEEPLPTDSKLLNVTFDPSFIYEAIGNYLSAAKATPIARKFLGRALDPIPNVHHFQYPELNEDQSRSIFEMTSVPIHMLWGPPGTGKTTTLGAAISGWMEKGMRVLVVSTSNAAVDVAMKAVLKRVKHKYRKHLLRLGTSLDQEVNDITLTGKLRRVDYRITSNARAAQDKLDELTEQLSHRTLTNERYQELFSEYSKLESVVHQANQKAQELLPSIMPDVRVIGCTLAKMVLDHNVFENEFDIVVVDEVSMVSVIYGIAASTLARSHLVLAGDPKQLPPICQSSKNEAQKWFGNSCYDWFGVSGVENDPGASKFSVLRTQYRMTNEIGGFVSRLSYGNMLDHGRNQSGSPVEFVDLPPEWQSTFYSVRDKSYYHLSSIPIIHGLASALSNHKELLLLSPFRPQRSLLSALAFDLQEEFPHLKVRASTIHKAQGSESRAVIVDLTTHQPNRPVAFFRDRHSANLFNVGISRAQDQLLVIGSRQMLRLLANESDFWGSVLDEIGNSVGLYPAEELLDDPIGLEALVAMIEGNKQDEGPALYAGAESNSQLSTFVDLLMASGATRKMLVKRNSDRQHMDKDLIVRHDGKVPAVFAACGHVAIPYQEGWQVVRSPNVARVVWRIGFSHLAEEEVNPNLAKRFFCPECATGNLVLNRAGGEGWFLACSNGQQFECNYRRRLSLEDAKLKVRTTGMTCPSNHPLTARTSSRGIFLGCENYPDCEHTASLSLLDGM